MTIMTPSLRNRLAVIRRIADTASDPGKTMIQKIVYFLQEGRGIPLGYRFKMHYYGPYSEQLDGNLSLANAMGIVEIRPGTEGFGFHVTPGEYNVEGSNWDWNKIDPTIQELSQLEIWRLELITTTHFVKSIRPQADEREVMDMVRKLKPKFPEETVKKAYDYVS